MKNKKEYIIGDFKTDNLDDRGIATYYYKQCTYLEEKNFILIKKISNLEKELEWYKNHQKIEVVNLGDSNANI